MSYDVFKEDLDAVIGQLAQPEFSGANVFDRLAAAELLTELTTALDELVFDILNYAASVGDESLHRQLSDIKSDLQSFEKETSAKLSARARRVDRALRVYTNVGARRETQAAPLGTLVEKRAQREAVQAAPTKNNDVFIVHGHDDAILHEVCRLVTDLGLTPIVLREKPSRGKTVIEKFEANADVGFAVVLMTADDIGGSLKETQDGVGNPRARQNVIMELGYFISSLTRERVAVLTAEGVEQPSDILGVVYTLIDRHSAWKTNLAKELKSAGYKIDLNKL
ncbi:TIR domain-containing protein [Tateyamaria sp.]|uniref:TIR domain-containing protein n=1 Tax=Tateyamaria sp. TaxID=1929288 RepID=UPI00329E0B63